MKTAWCMLAGTLLTAELALQHGLACNTAGGTHHAFPSFGSGFCILNDLAVTAEVLLHRKVVDRVLVLDLDVHQVKVNVCSVMRQVLLQCSLDGSALSCWIPQDASSQFFAPSPPPSAPPEFCLLSKSKATVFLLPGISVARLTFLASCCCCCCMLELIIPSMRLVTESCA